MNILSEQPRPLRRTSVVDSSKIRPLNVINELSKSLVQYHFHSWWLHRTYLSTKFVFHWFGLHIKKAHLTTELVRLAVFLQTILSRWSPRVCRSSNLTYIFIHQQGHGNVLYWTEVITVRNIRQPGLVDRTSVCICVYYYCTMQGPSCYKNCETESGIAHLCLLASNERIICCFFISDISLVWLRRQFHFSIGLYDE